MTSSAIALLFIAGCGTAVPLATDVLPMVQGGEVLAASDRSSASVVEQLDQWAHTDGTCVADAYGGLQLAADVRASNRNDKVLATYSQGIFVIDADGAAIASTPGFSCLGSQDALVAMKVIKVDDSVPIIAVAATRGGWRENATSLQLLAVATSRQLDQLFVVEIARHDEQGDHRGSVTLFPHGLLLQSPDHGMSLWTFDQITRRYALAVTLVRPSSEATDAFPVD